MTLIKGKQIEQSSATPQDVGTAAAVGTSTIASKEDHAHKMSAAAQAAVLATKLITQTVQVSAFSAGGASDDVTTVVEAAAANDTERNNPSAGLGILSTGTTTNDSASDATENYKLTIRAVATKEAVEDGNGGEVYGVLSFVAAVWTLTYYQEDGTSYTAFSATSIDFVFGEVTNLSALDPLVFMGIQQFGEMVDSGQIRVHQQEAVTTENISGTDTALADTLNATPVSNNSVQLYLNGVFQRQGATQAYTISGSTITWLASSGDAVDMETTDELIAKYIS